MTAAFMSLRKKPTHSKAARRARATCTKPQATHKYTVILLRPDYATNDFGQDTLVVYAEGADPVQAVAKARKDVAKADGLDKGNKGADYFVIAVMPGWQADINPERRK